MTATDPGAGTRTVGEADDLPPRPRRARRLIISCVVVLTAGAAAVVVVRDRADGAPPPKLPPTAATAPVTRGDLTAKETLDGTLEYADEVYLPNRLTGTVTWTARPGATVSRGGVLYRIDEKPVVLLYGRIPAYRAFAPGMADGGDVRQLEKNLAALGYTGFTVDETYTDGTAYAVRRWQRALGLPRTGQLELGRVLFAPQSVRAGEADRKPGDEAQNGSPVLDTTKAERTVTVKATMSQQRLLPIGKKVTVTIPGRDKPVAGKVTSVGTVVGGGGDDGGDKNGGDDDGGGDNGQGGGQNPQGGDRTVTVRIALADQKAAGALTYSPVRVEAEAERHRDVLSVPVAALLALREGGYGVQVVGDGSGEPDRILPVTTGLFSGGRVEVSGAGITEGLKVGTPAL
ncbi:peptidoglycan-binding protein [Streptomyces sp. ISL-99]|uniref:peptidoglycan-binding protein n=1 Tax=Streptomyces sp. ISL-99 TaxID=2819193 RepID=UPI001BECA20E|nr:peptidoglycan-binding protein [Streptomyces sp. ISL-99]MBT2528746.1 peptidoglycan-binding protein [Streptomyces sp. ISL-99]